MRIVDLLDDTERLNYRHAQKMGYVCSFVIYCLALIDLGNPIVVLALFGLVAFSSEYSREMEFSVTRSRRIVYFERFVWTVRMKWIIALFWGLIIIAFVGIFFTNPLINMDSVSHRAVFILIIGVFIHGLWPYLIRDFCIHHSGIFINRQFYPWRDVSGISWEGENGTVLVMNLKRETTSLPDIKQYRWVIPQEQKEKIETILSSRRPV